jgi:hypothetical protein
MSGFDILVSRPVDRKVLKTGLAIATGIHEQFIKLVDSPSLESYAPSIRILCRTSLNKGIFPFHLSIDAVQGQSELDMYEVVSALSIFLQEPILMDDGSSLPFRMKLVEPGKPPTLVEIYETDVGIDRVSRTLWVPPAE